MTGLCDGDFAAVMHRLRRVPPHFIFRGHVAVQRDDGTVDINFSVDAFRNLQAERRMIYFYNCSDDEGLLNARRDNCIDPRLQDLPEATTFIPNTRAPQLPQRVRRYYSDVVFGDDILKAPAKARALLERIKVLPNFCVPTALLKEHLGMGRAVAGILSFGPSLSGKPDIEYGVPEWGCNMSQATFITI